MSAAPSGWPRDLPPPGSDEFRHRVSGWLLDRGPAELRTSALRQRPEVLAVVIGHFLEGARQGLRTSYATARSELASVVPPNGMSEVLAALELLGVQIVQTQREVGLVHDVLVDQPATGGAAKGGIA